jgi:hypothetical protein
MPGANVSEYPGNKSILESSATIGVSGISQMTFQPLGSIKTSLGFK